MKKDPKREAAKRDGQRQYHGRACTLGHTRRYTSTGSCVECTLASQRVKPPVDAPPIQRTRPAGVCPHGILLKDPCRRCEVTWASRPRVVLPERQERLL